MAKLEIACFNTESAYIAAENGADRIEFCTGWKDGGLTPSEASLQRILADLSVDISVMVRPRGGDFIYNPSEFEIMCRTIEIFRKFPLKGFVFGILTPSLSLDRERCKKLVNLAQDIPCILHRSFDKTPDMDLALEETIACGFDTILTSGHASNAVDGVENLRKLVISAQDRIQIMPGGGIRSENIREIKVRSDAEYYHSSAIIDRSGIASAHEIKALIRNLMA